MEIETGWQLAVALGLLITLGTAVAAFGRVPVAGTIPWVAIRAGVQLLVVSAVIGFALSSPWLAFSFVLVMFLVGVATTSRRTGLRAWRARTAAGLSMLAGIAPVLLIVFASGTAPLTGPAIVPIAGIIVGNMMSAHTLIGRQAFGQLRSRHGEYEAWLSLGVERRLAIHNVVGDTLQEGLIPALDQTRTVGLVTLPGAYVGVLLGGGSPWEAAAAQVLVLVGINAGQICTAVAAQHLMSKTWLLPPDLSQRLQA